MKYRSLPQYFFVSSILLSFLIIGCSSDDGTSAADGEFIVADVETLFFETGERPDDATAALIDGGQFITLVIQGLDGNGNAIALIAPSYEGEGSYDLSFMEESNGTSGSFVAAENGTAFSSVGGDLGTGSLTVLSQNNEEIRGSFEFIGVNVNDENDTRAITNGSFRVRIDVQ